MKSTFSQLRSIHFAFVITCFLYIGILIYLKLPEKQVSTIFPLALGFVTVSTLSVGQTLRRKLVIAPAAALVSDPENTTILQRWRTGNIVSFVFAESIMLYGVVLKFMGARWNIAAIFLVARLLLQLLWAPRKIETMPRGVR
jgi:hypothetical protein